MSLCNMPIIRIHLLFVLQVLFCLVNFNRKGHRINVRNELNDFTNDL